MVFTKLVFKHPRVIGKSTSTHSTVPVFPLRIFGAYLLMPVERGTRVIREGFITKFTRFCDTVLTGQY
jgi:hypothetical protein